jgi:hypothetical protein
VTRHCGYTSCIIDSFRTSCIQQTMSDGGWECSHRRIIVACVIPIARATTLRSLGAYYQAKKGAFAHVVPAKCGH